MSLIVLVCVSGLIVNAWHCGILTFKDLRNLQTLHLYHGFNGDTAIYQQCQSHWWR